MPAPSNGSWTRFDGREHETFLLLLGPESRAFWCVLYAHAVGRQDEEGVVRVGVRMANRWVFPGSTLEDTVHELQDCGAQVALEGDLLRLDLPELRESSERLKSQRSRMRAARKATGAATTQPTPGQSSIRAEPGASSAQKDEEGMCAHVRERSSTCSISGARAPDALQEQLTGQNTTGTDVSPPLRSGSSGEPDLTVPDVPKPSPKIQRTSQLRDQVREAWEHHRVNRVEQGFDVRAKGPSEKELKAGEAALRRMRGCRDAPLETLMAASDWMVRSPHHRGENSAGTVYLSFELLCRKAETYEDNALAEHGAQKVELPF